MISEALNESDRLSSCNKRARKVMEPQAGPFHVYAFQAAELDEDGNPEDVILSFNLGGIRMNEAAFRKLEQEITLEPLKVKLPASLHLRQRRVPPVQRDRARRSRHLSQDRRAGEPHSANRSRGLSRSRAGRSVRTTKSAPTRRSTRRWKSARARTSKSISRRRCLQRPLVWVPHVSRFLRDVGTLTFHLRKAPLLADTARNGAPTNPWRNKLRLHNRI